MELLTTFLFVSGTLLHVSLAEPLLQHGKPIVTKTFIRAACKKKLTATVYTPCIRYPVPSEHRAGANIRIRFKLFLWDLVQAEGGGYHVRTCKRNYCLYWYSSRIDNWDYITLSEKPISRYFFFEKGKIHHKTEATLYGGGGDFSGESVKQLRYLSLVPKEPFEAQAYDIVSLDTARYDKLSFTSKTNTWLIRDENDWTWLVSPAPRATVSVKCEIPSGSKTQLIDKSGKVERRLCAQKVIMEMLNEWAELD